MNEYYLVSDLLHESLDDLNRQAGELFRERPRGGVGSFGLKIAKERDRLLALRQSLSPLREIMGRTTRGEFALISSINLPRFEDLYDRVIQLIEVVETRREDISDIRDILINVQTLTTNNIIRILTIISAIFLPLNLIAGIYGTNFETGFFMPGSSSSFGFYAMITIMIVLASTLLLVFRKRGWI